MHESSLLKSGPRWLRIVWRLWAPVALVILGLLVAWNGYRMWQIGLPGALARLPRLAIYLVLIIAVVLVRWVLKRHLSSLIRRGASDLKKQAAQQVVDEGLDRAESVFKKGVSGAKEALSDLEREAKDSWSQLTASPQAAHPTSAVSFRCPSCSKPVRVGARYCASCGAELKPVCPDCGRQLRPGAKFCDGCGNEIKPA